MVPWRSVPSSPQVVAVLRGHAGLRLAYVFGSRARGDGGAHSDLDVAVSCAGSLDANALGILAESLARATGISRVDVVDLSTAPPLVCDEVVRDGVCVIGSDEERIDFELRTFQRVQDTRPLRETQQRLLREVAALRLRDGDG